MTRDIPILFSAPMVRAIMSGQKTVTRRILKDAPTGEGWHCDRTAIGLRWVASAGAPSMPVRLRWEAGDRLFPAMSIPSLGGNYCADTYGSIWSRARDGKTWIRLKGSPTTKGYLIVTPATDGKYPTKLIHKLVAEAFYGNPPIGLKQVRHLNGDQANNAPENLDWGTHEDNWSDRLSHGRGAGELHHAAKLSGEDVAEIRSSALSQRALARKFGVAQSTIWGARHGKTWTEDPVAQPPNIGRWVSRITLEVTAVRVEQLHAITEAGCFAEGLEKLDKTIGRNGQIVPTRPYALNEGWNQQRTDSDDGELIEGGVYSQFGWDDPKAVYADLWDEINGAGSWDANPWIAAVTFRRVATIEGHIEPVREIANA